MNYKHYFAIERSMIQLGFKFERSELIDQFTEGKKTGLKELTESEYLAFTTWLHTSFIKNGITKQPLEKKSEALNKMRRKLLALFFKMGYHYDGKTDVKAVDSWCRKYGKFHKGLNEMDGVELPAVITQAENMYKTFIEGI